jgi:hypothetical protein
MAQSPDDAHYEIIADRLLAGAVVCTRVSSTPSSAAPVLSTNDGSTPSRAGFRPTSKLPR